MSNPGDNMTKANTLIGIIAGLVSIFIWLTGRSGLPELIFGKDINMPLQINSHTPIFASDIQEEMYKQYVDSAASKQNMMLNELAQRVGSLENKINDSTKIDSFNKKKTLGEGDCDLSDVTFHGPAGTTITLHSKKGNVYEFDGAVSVYAVNGKVTHTGSKLIVIKGSSNVNGQMKLLGDCEELIGTLSINKDSREVNVNMKR